MQIEENVRMIGKMVNEKKRDVRKKEMKMKRKEKKGEKIEHFVKACHIQRNKRIRTFKIKKKQQQ